MPVSIIGSVELHEVKARFLKKRGCIVYKSIEFPQWMTIPRRVIDPKDWKEIQRNTRLKAGIAKSTMTVHVLKAWYESTKLAIHACETGQLVRAVQSVRVATRDKTIMRTKCNGTVSLAGAIPKTYMR